jgi:cobalt/nickel transport system permease protein
MHIPDGFLSNNLARCFIAGALGMLGYCLSKILKAATIFREALMGDNGNSNIVSVSFGFSDNASKYFQNLATIAIWVFAFQMFNIPIQSATSAHLIGGVFAAVLAGPLEGFVIMSSVLILQSLFFSDGGILALGANIFNMAFVGSFLSYYIYKTFLNKNHYFAVFAACLFSALTASLSCLIELSISGTVSFLTAFEDMMSMHFIVALLETGITLVLLKIFKNLTRDTDE